MRGLEESRFAGCRTVCSTPYIGDGLAEFEMLLIGNVIKTQTLPTTRISNECFLPAMEFGTFCFILESNWVDIPENFT
jgi:hypothetical protein